MKALVLTEQPEIALQEVAKPGIEAGKVLVKMQAAALNRRDQWIRVGLYPGMTYGCILGADGCGTVEEVGEGVAASWLGQEVVLNPNNHWGSSQAHQSAQYHILGMPSNGTFAEYLLISADRLQPKPAHLSVEEAAALPLAGLTAYRALFTRGELKAGQKVLVTGIGGGVAQFAAQFALAAGAEVYVSSGDDAKIEKMKSLGISGGANYRREGWHKELLKSSGGFDLVIDSAGGKDFNLLLRTLQPAGTVVFYGATLGPAPIDMPRVFFGQHTIKGSTMGSDEEFVEMLAFVAKHQIKPVLDSVRPFGQIVEAINDMRDSKIFGKVVLHF
jgi:NADPH:quinone reductase-like Zn-dependent oxidoreductase